MTLAIDHRMPTKIAVSSPFKKFMDYPYPKAFDHV
jgi:hypothetical protein